MISEDDWKKEFGFRDLEEEEEQKAKEKEEKSK